MSNPALPSHPSNAKAFALLAILLLPIAAFGESDNSQVQELRSEVDQLKLLVADLRSHVLSLEQQNSTLQGSCVNGSEDAAALIRATATLRRPPSPQPDSLQQVTSTSSVAHFPTVLPGGATLNYYFDGYFENNFNDPVGRVNDLRAYDVLSRTFSINQADVIFDLDPDVQASRRYGVRIDLQFGQATETSQGNPSIEPRPEIYRNLFQAYGTYVFPLGSGLKFDFGKWASSLGMEGNYTKDQINYSRSYYFYLLPFYHAGIRLHYDFNNKFGVNYWLVNGTNQSEPNNGYRDELFGYVLQPKKTLSWTFNYYLGQEHPDIAAATNCIVPVQPGLCYAPLRPAENGKLHIFDTYGAWNVTPKLTVAAEGDYVIQRVWANAAPGKSSAPEHDDGGAAYVQYHFTPRQYGAVRTEYLSDRGGMFSNVNQALKEVTATYRYDLGHGFSSFFEYRRDWSNVPYFATSNPAAPSTHQDTLGIGLVWWYGEKKGAW